MTLFSPSLTLLGPRVRVPRATHGAFSFNDGPLRTAGGAFFVSIDPFWGTRGGLRGNRDAFSFNDGPLRAVGGAFFVSVDPFWGTRDGLRGNRDALSITGGEYRKAGGQLNAVPVEPGVSGFAAVFANRADSSLRSPSRPSHAERMQRNDSG